MGDREGRPYRDTNISAMGDRANAVGWRIRCG